MANRLIFSPKNVLRAGPLRAFKSQKKAARAGAWFLAINGHERAAKWCADNGVPVIRASEGVNTAGGFLVPDVIMRAVIALREVRGAFRAAADIAPMGSDTALIPRRSSGLTATFTAENALIPEGQVGFDNVGLVAKKLGVLTRSSSELDEDAAIDLGEWLAREMAYAFAAKEDDCGFNGDGTATYGGIVGLTTKILDGTHNAGKLTATVGHDTYAEIDMIDLTNLMALLPAYALPGARWFCSQFAFATVFCRLSGSAGGILMMRDGGRPVPTFNGFPVQLAQVMPQVGTTLLGKVMIAFGDLSLCATLGERRGVTVARSDDRYLDTDQVGWRATERVDINVHDLGDNTTAGPVVGLVGG